jgi:hypothetical protein
MDLEDGDGDFDSGYSPMAGHCEHGNEPSGSTKGEVFLYQLTKSRSVAGIPPHRLGFNPCGLYGTQSGTRAVFLRVLLFPLPIVVPPTVPRSLIIRRYISTLTT